MELMKIFQENTVLPKLTEEWFWRRTVSEFGNFNPARQKQFINLNSGLRENAAVNDMAAESQSRVCLLRTEKHKQPKSWLSVFIECQSSKASI